MSIYKKKDYCTLCYEAIYSHRTSGYGVYCLRPWLKEEPEWYKNLED